MPESLSEAVRAGRPEAIARVVTGPIPIRSDNLVERPWGGQRILAYKGLSRAAAGSRRFGEAFEIAAFPEDPEARAHPSVARFEDGSELALPALLGVAAGAILGEDQARAGGPCIPILPKTLDVETLLSVQAHPPGHAEAYIVLAAEEGATIRVGFRRDVTPGTLGARLRQGRLAQEALLDAFRPGVDQTAIHTAMAGALARRDCTGETLAAALAPHLRPDAGRARVMQQLDLLACVYWEILDLMNEIPIPPGRVIFNATPVQIQDQAAARSPGALGRQPSAEVHALGNPEGKAILMLEVRRPGPTLRAWDHVRFPLRPIDIEAALGAMSCRATRPRDFLREPRPTSVPGVLRSVDSDLFVIDHVRPEPGATVYQETRGRLRTLHAIRGSAVITDAGGAVRGRLRQGESALVPATLGGYGLAAADGDAALVQVTLRLSC